MSSELIIFTRTALADAEICPRKRWWTHEYRGRGVAPIGKAVPLVSGGLLHGSIELLLAGSDVEFVAATMLEQYAQEVRASGLQLDGMYEGQDPRDVVEEQKALCEALIRAWNAVRQGPFLAEYRVLNIEQESEASFEWNGHQLRMLTRADLLVERREDGQLFIWNFKSTKEANRKWRDQWPLDMQTLSEVLAIEQHLAPTVRLGGVIIEGLLKGKRLEYPEGSGNWYHNSPLTQAWFKAGEAPFGVDEWHARYAWTDVEGRQHRLGKGYRKVAVWSNYPGGVRAWIEHLLLTDPELLREQFIVLPPLRRNDAAMEDWKEQTLPAEVDIAQAAAWCNTGHRLGDDDELRAALNLHFPQHTSHGNCIWPSRCSCFEICWGAAGIHPEESGLYQLRQANHPAEAELRDWPSAAQAKEQQ